MLLARKVTVRQARGHTLVQAVDPAELLAMAGDKQGGHRAVLARIAGDASAKLRAALDSLNPKREQPASGGVEEDGGTVS